MFPCSMLDVLCAFLANSFILAQVYFHLMQIVIMFDRLLIVFLEAACGTPYIVFISTSGMLRLSDIYIWPIWPIWNADN